MKTKTYRGFSLLLVVVMLFITFMPVIASAYGDEWVHDCGTACVEDCDGSCGHADHAAGEHDPVSCTVCGEEPCVCNAGCTCIEHSDLPCGENCSHIDCDCNGGAQQDQITLKFHGIFEEPINQVINLGGSFNPNAVQQPVYTETLAEGKEAVFEGWRLEDSDKIYNFDAISGETAAELNFYPVFEVRDIVQQTGGNEGGTITPYDLTVNVEFIANGELHEKQKVPIGGTATVPVAPNMPAGMVSFVGWSKAVSGESGIFDFSTAIEKDTALYAQFSDKYLISFKDADGDIYLTQLVESGKSVAAPITTPPSGTEEVFLYWAIDGTNDRFDFSAWQANANITLRPVYGNSYYVYFNSKGGTPVDEQLIAKNEKAETPTPPTRDGYDFAFWSEDPAADFNDSATYAFDFSSAIIESKTLYAIWTPKVVQAKVIIWNEKENLPLDFNKNDTSNYVYSSSYMVNDVLAGSKVTYTADDLRDGSIPNYSEFYRSVEVTIAGDGSSAINVYCTRIVYTIYFDMMHEGAQMQYKGNTYTYDSPKYSFQAKYNQVIADVWPLNEGGNSITREGYAFQGWGAPIELNEDYGAVLWVSRRITLSEGMLPDANFGNGDEREYTMSAAWIVDCFDLTLNYMFEALPGYSTDGKTFGRDYVTHNGTVYVRSDLFTQDAVSNGSAFYLKDIDGVTAVTEEALRLNSGTGQLEAIPNLDVEANQYLLYDRERYSITFDKMNGEADKVIPNIFYEEPIEGYKIADPVREGYDFKGWYLDRECITPFSFDGVTMPHRNLELYAKWEPNALKARFYDEAGGTLLYTQGVERGGKVPLPQSSDTHYRIVGGAYPGLGIFKGWYTTLNSGIVSPFQFDNAIEKDVVIYGCYQTDGFTVKYFANGGIGDVPVDNETYKLDVFAPIKNANLTLGSKVLVGWQEVGKGGAIYYPGSTILMYGNVELEAVYADSNALVKLIYNANDGSMTPDTITDPVIGGKAAILRSNDTFTRSGYRLIGWSLNPNATTPDYVGGESYNVPVNGATLYAVWQKIQYFTVKYEVFPGQEDRGSIVTTGDQQKTFSGIEEGTASSIAVPVDRRPSAMGTDYYYFAGWSRSLPTTITEDITIYAKFSPKTIIDLKEVSAAIKDTSKTYSEFDPEGYELKDLPAGVDQSFFDITWERDDGNDVGGYEVRVATIALKPAYQERYKLEDGTVKPGTLTINPRKVTIKPNGGQFKVKGEDDPTPFTASESFEALANEDTSFVKAALQYGVERARGEDIGRYKLYITSTDKSTSLSAIQAANTNYIVSVEEDVFRILTDGQIVIIVSDGSKMYGTADGDLKALYSKVIGLNEGDTLDYSVMRAKGENVTADGYAYDVTYNMGSLPMNTYDNVTVETGMYTITPRPVILVANSYSKYTDESDPAFTAYLHPSSNSLVGEDKLRYNVYRNDPSDNSVGNKTIFISLGSNPNYSVSIAYGNLAIKERTGGGPTDPGTPIIVVPTDPIIEAEIDPDIETPDVEEKVPDDAPDNVPEVISDPDAPLAAPASWALLNLILAIVTVIVGVILLVGIFRKNKKDDEDTDYAVEEEDEKRKSGIIWRIFGIIAAILAPIVFFLTENMKNPMIFTDKWTLLMALILLVQVVAVLLMRYVRNREENEDEKRENT